MYGMKLLLRTKICGGLWKSRSFKTACSNSSGFSHVDSSGRVAMVDVGSKPVTLRKAEARGKIMMPVKIIEEIKKQNVKKGDVLTVAQIAGICGAKKTYDLIPLCHNIFISKIDVSLQVSELTSSVDIRAVVTAEAKTGVEMEALTAVMTSALTVYDMCKALSKDMIITDVHLVSKTGGKEKIS